MSGEKAAEEESKKAEAKMAELKRRAEAKEMQKEVLDVNSHPLRKPSFLLREITKKTGALTNIYNQLLKRGEDFSGTLKLVFYIESNGQVSHVQIDESSDINNEEFRQKVIQNVQTWIFPAIEDGYKPQKVNFPIGFKKSE